jgi:hypothetical protein
VRHGDESDLLAHQLSAADAPSSIGTLFIALPNVDESVANEEERDEKHRDCGPTQAEPHGQAEAEQPKQGVEHPSGHPASAKRLGYLLRPIVLF